MWEELRGERERSEKEKGESHRRSQPLTPAWRQALTNGGNKFRIKSQLGYFIRMLALCREMVQDKSCMCDANRDTNRGPTCPSNILLILFILFILPLFLQRHPLLWLPQVVHLEEMETGGRRRSLEQKLEWVSEKKQCARKKNKRRWGVGWKNDWEREKDQEEKNKGGKGTTAVLSSINLSTVVV